MSKPSSPFRSPKLPTEVCEAIISYVDEDAHLNGDPYRLLETTKTLHSCTLVCRSWITTARIHLFRNLTIESRSASNIMAVLMTSNALGSYVQRVELALWKDHRLGSISTMSTIPENNGWIYDFLKRVVLLLPNLTHIRYDGLPTQHPRFYICPPRIPSLTSLSLFSVNAASIGDVLRLISYYNCLKELHLVEGSWGHFREHHYHFGQRWKCNLRVLSIQQSTVCGILDLFHWLARLRAPCSVEHLILNWGWGGSSVGIKRAPPPYIPEYVTPSWASTLKTLSLKFVQDYGDGNPPCKSNPISRLLPVAKACYNLHTIRLQTNSDRYEILGQLPDLLPALRSLRRFAFCIGKGIEGVLRGENGELWGNVDRVFKDSGNVLKLEYFEVMWGNTSDLEIWRQGETRTNGDGESTSGRLGIYVDLLKAHFADYDHKKPLTSIFPHLSARGILWYSLFKRIEGVDSRYAMHISPEVSSPNWSPRYRLSILDFNWCPDD